MSKTTKRAKRTPGPMTTIDVDKLAACVASSEYNRSQLSSICGYDSSYLSSILGNGPQRGRIPSAFLSSLSMILHFDVETVKATPVAVPEKEKEKDVSPTPETPSAPSAVPVADLIAAIASLSDAVKGITEELHAIQETQNASALVIASLSSKVTDACDRLTHTSVKSISGGYVKAVTMK